jgi:hypothetical protein
MKIGPELTPAQKARNLKELDDSKYDEKLIAKLSPGFCNRERNLVTDKILKKVRHTKNDVFFKSENIRQIEYKEFSDAWYWYRCMSREDFLYLVNHNQVKIDRPKDYGGIAPNFDYVVTNYFKKGGGSHIVEFKMNVNGRDFCEAAFELEKKKKGKKAAKQTPKAEGGGSIGLGPAGTYAGTAGELFNSQLQSREITWRLVNFRVANPLPNDELFYVFQ